MTRARRLFGKLRLNIFWLATVSWRLALAALLLMLTWQAYNLRHLPGWAQAQIQREGAATRTAAQAAIADNLKPVLAEVKGWRTDTNAQLNTLRGALLGPKDSLKVDLLSRVDTIQNTLVTRVDSIGVDLQRRADALNPVLADVKHVTGAAAEQSDLLGQCDHNPDCLANRLIPVMKNAEKMAAAGEKTFNAVAKEAAPTAKAVREVSQQTAGIATDIHKAVSDATKPEPWYRKVGHGAYAVLVLLAHFL